MTCYNIVYNTILHNKVKVWHASRVVPAASLRVASPHAAAPANNNNDNNTNNTNDDTDDNNNDNNDNNEIHHDDKGLCTRGCTQSGAGSELATRM